MLKNDQLHLKILEKTNLPDRHRWLNDPETTRYFTNLGAIPLTLNNLEQWYVNTQQNKSEIHFAVYTPDDKHIGGAQLKAIDWKNRSAELGLFIGEPDFRGKGLGQQITKLLVAYGFNQLNLHRIWLRVDEHNQAAIKCYKKCGFSQEGIFRDEVFRDGGFHNSIVMSILKGEQLKPTCVN